MCFFNLHNEITYEAKKKKKSSANNIKAKI